MLHRHLTLDQRYQIAYLFSGHISKKSITETISCHPSTVTRELQRNRTDKPYAGSIAHGQAKQRRRSASSRPHVSDYIYRHMVERLNAKQRIIKAFGQMAEPVHTLTCDRGSEFSLPSDLEKKLQALVYFADARSPWQRGSVENFNGLLRQYFPRSFDFSRITAGQLRAVETQVNDRPRKRLNYWNPAGVFFNQLIALQS